MGAWPLTASTVQHPIRRCCSHRQDTSRAQTCGQSQTPRPGQRRARQSAIKKTSAIHVTSLLHRKKKELWIHRFKSSNAPTRPDSEEE